MGSKLTGRGLQILIWEKAGLDRLGLVRLGFFNKINLYEKEIFMGELSVGRIVRWANCPLGNFSVSELSVGEYSGHEKKYAQHFNHRLSEIF